MIGSELLSERHFYGDSKNGIIHENDYVRTWPTHSLEVSAIGKRHIPEEDIEIRNLI